ncbi:polyadenylate-binding protein 3-like, partial [Ipomoea triloba]|uniref:polyadenylate-binding protein 3-like n=1 Tax=Ipomoea triloba TaxID=35885 RepID=UPI00125E5444
CVHILLPLPVFHPILSQQVDYACTPEEVQQHFQACGTVNRVTILTDKFGQPKGFAYVEFVEQEAIQEALQLNESELHGRQLKVMPKRTNVPGMKQFRPRRFNPYMGGYRFRRPYVPPYFYSPYGYGKVPSSGGSSPYTPY